MKKVHFLALMILLLSNCAHLGPRQDGPFQLGIFHLNDHHSRLGPNGQKSLVINGEDRTVEVGGMERVAAFFRKNANKYPHSLRLHAGDALSGDLYYVLYKGQADGAVLGDLCLDAFTLGNHEFDDSDSNLVQFLRVLQQGSCPPVVLSANTRPLQGTPLAPNRPWEFFQPFVVKSLGTEKVGIVGITVAEKTKLSSRPLPSTAFLAELAVAQEYIQVLKQQGIGKIILLTHQGYEVDVAMAAQLSAVDIIVGGHSHSLLGDFASVGLESAGPYPTVTKNADGDLVCVVQAGAYAEVVGELVANFVGDRIESCGGRPHLLVEENLATGNSPVLTAIGKDAETTQRMAPFQHKLRTLSQQKIATVPEKIGFGRTDQRSDIHQLVTAAFLSAVPGADLALQNGGGVRRELPAGKLTVDVAYQLLPFANTLYLFRLSDQQIKQLLEEAVDFALSPSGGGSYPHGAGIRFSVNLKNAKNQRVSEIKIRNRPLEMGRTYQVVANSFIASGKDGWFTLGQALAAGQGEDTYLNYTQTFIDYARKKQTLRRPAPDSHSTVEFIR